MAWALRRPSIRKSRTVSDDCTAIIHSVSVAARQIQISDGRAGSVSPLLNWLVPGPSDLADEAREHEFRSLWNKLAARVFTRNLIRISDRPIGSTNRQPQFADARVSHRRSVSMFMHNKRLQYTVRVSEP